jgi:hypothetical protein
MNCTVGSGFDYQIGKILADFLVAGICSAPFAILLFILWIKNGRLVK